MSPDVPTTLAPGTRCVQWTVPTPDGHKTQGSLEFAMLDARPGAEPAAFAVAPLPVFLLVGIAVSRWVGWGLS
jgi:hypothetical protein